MTAFAKDCLGGKAVLITGGLGAIGRVVVTALLSHSARVAVNDVLAVEQAEQLRAEFAWPADRFVYVRADVTNPAGAEELVQGSLDAFGRLDIALCHAGMAQSCPILRYSEQDWDKVMDVNLKSAFVVAQALARAMLERGTKGKIIFTSSWVQDVPWPDITPYNVTKSGMKMLMKGMARELAGNGIPG